MTTIANAAAFLESEYGATGMKLQKVLYYAQATALVQRGVPLFPEEFQAWRLGPVNRDVWDGLRQAAPLSSEDEALLRATWAQYGPLTAYELSDLSHDDGPWQEVRGDLPPEVACERVIPHALMQAFYVGRQLVKRPDGTWEHAAPAHAQWAQAKARLVVARKERQGLLSGAERGAFIHRQVIATQRLEGLTVTIPGGHG